MPRQMAQVWYYWTIKRKGQTRDTDIVACNNCNREYVRRAHRCVKHTASCLGKSQYELKDMVKYESSLFEVQGITTQELHDATQAIGEGQLIQATGQTMADGTVLVSVVEGQDGQQMYLVNKDGQHQQMQIVQAAPKPRPKRKRGSGEDDEYKYEKASRLSARLRGRDQDIKGMRKELMDLQRKFNDNALQIQSKDMEFEQLKANSEALQMEVAKVQGQLEEADKWKQMVGEVMSMARTVVAQREAGGAMEGLQ